MTRQATLYISNHTERLAQEIAEHRGLPAERYRTRLYEALVSEEHSRIQAQEAEMTKRRMGTAEIRGEALYDAATNMSIAEALENYGSAEAVAQAVVELLGEGDPADVVAYIEYVLDQG